MKDSELRALVLRKYYDARTQREMIQVPALVDDAIDAQTAFRISEQLSQHGLIDWRPLRGSHFDTGMGKITAFGADVIEGSVTPPITFTFNDNSVRISNSSSVQIGSGNFQNVQINGERISLAIDGSDASQKDKAEAKSLLAKVLDNPLLSTILAKLGLGGG